MDLLVTIMSKMRKELRIIRYIWINPMLLNTMLFIRIVTLVEWSILTYILFIYDKSIIIEYIKDPIMGGGYNQIYTAITVVKILFYYFCENALIDYRTVISY
tara:strand:+ start:35 stop:340 length:306 start_codon:yes stop_codon:yes gene_type:complete